MITLRSGKFRINAILRKTSAKTFRDWKPGDIIRFQMTLKHTGGASAGNYATKVWAGNLTQKTAVIKSQSEMVNVLRAFDLEEYNEHIP